MKGDNNDAENLNNLIEYVRNNVNANGIGTKNLIIIPSGIYHINLPILLSPIVKLKTIGTVVFLWEGEGTCLFVRPDDDDNQEIYDQIGFFGQSKPIDASNGGLILKNTKPMGQGVENIGLEVGPRHYWWTNPMFQPKQSLMMLFDLMDISIVDFDVGILESSYNTAIGGGSYISIQNCHIAIRSGRKSDTWRTSGENLKYHDCTFNGNDIFYRYILSLIIHLTVVPLIIIVKLSTTNQKLIMITEILI